jgi:hypothetical protein
VRRDRLLREHLRHRFVITMKTGETFDGLLNDQDESTVEFVDAGVLTRDGRVVVDGALFLPRAGIAYLQRAGQS